MFSKVLKNVGRDVQKNTAIYIMLIPVFAYYILFLYVPMYGASIAFKDFSPGAGIMGSPWIGFTHFKNFFSSYNFWQLIRNTVSLSLMQLAFGFPAPIILALMLNEVRMLRYKRIVQTVVYLPYFISLVIVCGLIKEFVALNGPINSIISLLGGKPQNWLLVPSMFRPIFVSSNIWQHVGWNSIVYLAAIAGINPELYEAAVIDGAGRFRQLVHITLASIAPTIIIMFILRIGQIMNVSFEKVMLLYSPPIYEVSDVISTYVYRSGILDMNYSYSTAVGLFNTVINFLMLILANKISRVVSETSLW